MSYYKESLGPPRMRRCRFFCKRGVGSKVPRKKQLRRQEVFWRQKKFPDFRLPTDTLCSGETDARIDDTAHHNALRSHICHVYHICRNAPRYL